MKTMWKGALNFGLVNVPVKMHTATEKKSIKFKYLHKDCHAPVEYKRICSACNKEISWDEIIKGYEYEPGRYVEIDEKELENIPDERSKTIEILDFVDLKDIDPVYYDKTYYLSPQETGERAYLLLKKALENNSKVAICKVIIRSKESLACVRVYNDVLTLETMFYPDEVRDVGDITSFQSSVKVHDKELEMANKLIENLTSEFDPGKYKDNYREALLELIRSKVEGKEIKTPKLEQEDKVVDLMEALKESVKMVEEDEDQRTG
ncbi:Ku protein [Natranaerofaba carboxydovora]|uniref:non-homologous end joining protein Ku n=1 Tax=Natranaerofaba carboxydovora TaxID=2742683 RepID=UPI001F13A19F|nr:Ku protein [Natranaerofaba carboxydovora]UMZ75336.1 Non-homologous end joining protein Ku [Natranaerofaba carboxydovora]